MLYDRRMCKWSMKYLPVYFTVAGVVSCVTTSVIELTPDILHLYSVKSVGHWTLFLSMVSFSCAPFGVSMFPVATARFCNADPEGHWIPVFGPCPESICNAVPKPVLLFLWSCM